MREVHEETGVDATVVRQLGVVDTTAPHGDPRRNLFFELRTHDSRSEWEHVVRGAGEDSGMVFLCRFVPLEPKPALIADDVFLEHL